MYVTLETYSIKDALKYGTTTALIAIPTAILGIVTADRAKNPKGGFGGGSGLDLFTTPFSAIDMMGEAIGVGMSMMAVCAGAMMAIYTGFLTLTEIRNTPKEKKLLKHKEKLDALLTKYKNKDKNTKIPKSDKEELLSSFNAIVEICNSTENKSNKMKDLEDQAIKLRDKVIQAVA